MGHIKANRKTIIFILFFIISQTLLQFITSILTKISIDPLFDNENYFLIFIVFFISFIFTIFFIFLLSNQAVRIFGMDVKTVNAENQKGLAFLLMGYSPNTLTSEQLSQELKTLGVDNIAKNAAGYEEACKAQGILTKRSPWQQNIRAAWHHYKADTLKAIYVLDRHNKQEKVEEDFAQFKKYLKEAFPNKIDIIRISQPEDDNKPFIALERSGAIIPSNYEHYDYVYYGLRRGLEMIRGRTDLAAIISQSKINRIARDDAINALTCIDATPGQKPFSIAAAALTLNSELSYSYVTNDGELRFYDTNLRLGSGR